MCKRTAEIITCWGIGLLFPSMRAARFTQLPRKNSGSIKRYFYLPVFISWGKNFLWLITHFSTKVVTVLWLQTSAPSLGESPALTTVPWALALGGCRTGWWSLTSCPVEHTQPWEHDHFCNGIQHWRGQFLTVCSLLLRANPIQSSTQLPTPPGQSPQRPLDLLPGAELFP